MGSGDVACRRGELLLSLSEVGGDGVQLRFDDPTAVDFRFELSRPQHELRLEICSDCRLFDLGRIVVVVQRGSSSELSGEDGDSLLVLADLLGPAQNPGTGRQLANRTKEHGKDALGLERRDLLLEIVDKGLLRSEVERRREGSRSDDEILLRFGESKLGKAALLRRELQRRTGLRSELTMARGLLRRLLELDLQIREGRVELLVVGANNGKLRANLQRVRPSGSVQRHGQNKNAPALRPKSSPPSDPRVPPPAQGPHRTRAKVPPSRPPSSQTLRSYSPQRPGLAERPRRRR